MPEEPFEIHEEDFVKTMVDYEMFKREIDLKEFKEKMAKKILYSSNIDSNDEYVNISIEKGGEDD